MCVGQCRIRSISPERGTTESLETCWSLSICTFQRDAHCASPHIYGHGYDRPIGRRIAATILIRGKDRNSSASLWEPSTGGLIYAAIVLLSADAPILQVAAQWKKSGSAAPFASCVRVSPYDLIWVASPQTFRRDRSASKYAVPHRRLVMTYRSVDRIARCIDRLRE